MKTVLWVSRHEMTPEQFADLERVMGDAVKLQCWRENVRDVTELKDALHGVDAAAVVLPMELLAQMLPLAEGKPVLQAVSKRKITGRMITLSDGRQEPEALFVHGGWKQVLRVEIETRML